MAAGRGEDEVRGERIGEGGRIPVNTPHPPSVCECVCVCE